MFIYYFYILGDTYLYIKIPFIKDIRAKTVKDCEPMNVERRGEIKAPSPKPKCRACIHMLTY